jgi:anti-anti-sigma factor
MSLDRATTERLDVQVEHADGVVVVRPRGEVDMASAPALRDIMRDLGHRGASVHLDLSEVTFIDSTGLRLVWDADAESRADGRHLTLSAGPPQVMRVFDLTGLTRRLPFTDPS